jgi:predicted DNA-binding antitoxin AbrB/MazE fold protein
MVTTIDAIYDGEVLHPESPLVLEPNTRVRITIETVEPASGEAFSFLRTARSLNLDGPPDWAANLDAYLYGGDVSSDE